jgi:flagellar biosynthesis protein FlhA
MSADTLMGRLPVMLNQGLGAPFVVLAILGMMVLPLPTTLLDLLFTFNISLSLIVLLAVVYSRKPLDLSVFPTLLLLVTLLRLSLNVASTRVVLLNGHNGTAAAGHVIEAFGEFVVGGNYTVGFAVFIILIIINFVVITKGAGRISEVSARFTLDAMPGKQMAIDADLNAGVINQEEARQRRTEVAQEADFYGSMDGASKFVRGDAMAGILILFVNIIGGFAIGTMEHGLSLAEAVKVYSLLTIGDGLVAQIPGLLLATASAIMVTRVSSPQDMSQQLVSQLVQSPQTLGVASGVLLLLGVIPGMPNTAFLGMGALCAGGAWLQARRDPDADDTTQVVEDVALPSNEVRELGWDDVQPVDAVSLEVGFRLIPMVDKSQGGQLLGRLKGVRRKLSQELGFLLPAVHIRDNLDLQPANYRIALKGVAVAEAEVQPDRDLAINPGQVYGELQGIPGRDPVFDLEATWIETSQREEAQAYGYTVVDASTVVATHLSQMLQNHAHELLGHDEVQQILNRLSQSSPKLVEDLVPKVLPLGTVVHVLQGLLREHIPVRDIRTILESLAAAGVRSQDPVTLLAAVRISLGRSIVQQINGLAEELPVITLDPALEQMLLQAAQVSGSDGNLTVDPALANRLLRSVKQVAETQEAAGNPVVLVVPDAIREPLARFLRPAHSGLHVLAYGELPDNKRLRIVASVDASEHG